jgi:imidazolonepropionase-like amidohydrolase
MAGMNYESGSILIKESKILKVGENIDIDKYLVNENIDKSSLYIIDAEGKFTMPGMIDPHCHVGMWEDGMGFEGDDGNEMTDPITPQLEAIDGINPFDRCFREALEAGVTTVVTGPGSANVIAGQFAALKTYGSCIEDMIIKAPCAMKVAFGENPKKSYSEKDEMPMTRMAMAAMLKENLFKAKDYARKKDEARESNKLCEIDETYSDDVVDGPEFDLKLEALEKVIRREIPLKAHAHRADDILAALRIAKQFDLDITIDHCTEGQFIIDELVKRNVKVIVGPVISERSKIELKNASVKTPGVLSKAGLKVALMTDHPVIPVQYLPLNAAIAAREGMDKMEALKAITINAAEIVGIADRVGSIEEGKDADIVIFSGHPLDIFTKPDVVILNGKVIEI